MSMKCDIPECNLDYGGIVAVGIPTNRGYVIMNPPKFYIIQLKKKMYDAGYSLIEIEEVVNNLYL